jgi:hypothetical protein
MLRHIAAVGVALAVAGCTDNPTAIDDLNPEVEFDIEATRVETFTETPIRVQAMESGMPMTMQEAYLEVRHAEEEDARRFTLEKNADGYEARAYFYEEGDYHLRMMGLLDGHAIVAEFGEYEISVSKQRQLIGPYWIEIDIPGGPVLENSARDLHLLVFDLLADSSRGNPVSGLTISASIHAPDGDERAVPVEDEGSGEYAMTYEFDHGGLYELHVALEVGGVELEGEFRAPVHEVDPSDNGISDTGEGGGHGH